MSVRLSVIFRGYAPRMPIGLAEGVGLTTSTSSGPRVMCADSDHDGLTELAKDAAQYVSDFAQGRFALDRDHDVRHKVAAREC